jgi:hypothetical protein
MIEEIIRPFASPGALATRRVPVVNTQTNPIPGSITWGGSGTAPTAIALPDQTPVGMDFTLIDPYTEKYVEKSRVVVPQKIVNPSDPSQFVIVDQTKKSTFAKTTSNAPAPQTVYTGDYNDYVASIDPSTGVSTGVSFDDPAGTTTTTTMTFEIPLPQGGPEIPLTGQGG